MKVEHHLDGNWVVVILLLLGLSSEVLKSIRQAFCSIHNSTATLSNDRTKLKVLETPYVSFISLIALIVVKVITSLSCCLTHLFTHAFDFILSCNDP